MSEAASGVKWTMFPPRSEPMQTPSKTDLETLAIRLGCPAHLVEGGVVLTFVHEARTLDHLSGRRDVCGVTSPFADHLRHGGRWWIMAGARRDTGALGAGCSVPGWSKSISDIPDGASVGAFWSLWDSVGDLNPETKQAGREAEVAAKRNATSSFEAVPTVRTGTGIDRVDITIGKGRGRTYVHVNKRGTELVFEAISATFTELADGTVEVAFTVDPSGRGS